MNKDLFTFSIQEAETLGIECAIVLAASKDLKIASSTNDEILVLLKEKIPFLREQEILDHLERLISLKLGCASCGLLTSPYLEKLSMPITS